MYAQQTSVKNFFLNGERVFFCTHAHTKNISE